MRKPRGNNKQSNDAVTSHLYGTNGDASPPLSNYKTSDDVAIVL